MVPLEARAMGCSALASRCLLFEMLADTVRGGQGNRCEVLQRCCKRLARCDTSLIVVHAVAEEASPIQLLS